MNLYDVKVYRETQLVSLKYIEKFLQSYCDRYRKKLIYDTLLEFWHNISGNLDEMGENDFHVRVRQEKNTRIGNTLSCRIKKD